MGEKLGDFEVRIRELEESVACLHSSRPLCCYDCGRRYEKGPDLHVSNDDWARIAPHDGGGVLCPNCMHDRFVALGVPDGSVKAAFMSGPFSVDSERVAAEVEAIVAWLAAKVPAKQMLGFSAVELKGWALDILAGKHREKP